MSFRNDLTYAHEWRILLHVDETKGIIGWECSVCGRQLRAGYQPLEIPCRLHSRIDGVTTMPRPDIEAALARADAATEGEAHVVPAPLGVIVFLGETECNFEYGNGDADARLFLAARTDLPAIARYALALEEMVYEAHHAGERDGFPEACFCDVCAVVFRQRRNHHDPS